MAREILIAIDPGDAKAAGNVCYAAVFGDGELRNLHGFTPETARKWREHAGAGPEVVGVEKPHMDVSSRRVPPKILINLAWNGALVAQSLEPGQLVALTPSEWKGGINKHPHHLQIWRRLSIVEQATVGKAAAWTRKRSGPLTPAQVYAVLRAASQKYVRTGKITKHAFYDVLDAVGLGLRHLKRIGRR